MDARLGLARTGLGRACAGRRRRCGRLGRLQRRTRHGRAGRKGAGGASQGRLLDTGLGARRGRGGAGGRAVGISGKDDDMMVCEADDPELGFVGRPIEMNVQIIRDLYNAGLIPVIAPVATGMEDNETFNVNGDTAAGAIAGALRADRLLLLTDVSGVKDASGEVLTALKPQQVRDMIVAGTIAGGMIPKTETALKAIEEGVRAVTILDGRVPNAVLLELFTEHGAGTLLVP